MRVKGEYVNGLREGVWRWWNSQGICVKEVFFIEGILHGTVTDRSQDGRVVREAHYRNGDEISSGYIARAS